MRVISFGTSGSDVRAWQTFLRGRGYAVLSDGLFGEDTKHATVEFQVGQNLNPDGIVGRLTIAAAIRLGFDPMDQQPDYPPAPGFDPLVSAEARHGLFGRFGYELAPTADNPEGIRVLGDWEKRNIALFPLPQLKGIRGSGQKGNVRFHVLARRQLEELWAAWEREGLLRHVLTWGGAYMPRFVRGSRTVLSNHAFGTAFDINMEWNRLGSAPAERGQKGCVFDLVALAHEHGFYWGGHFTRKDGMHFEIARLA